MKQDVLVGMIIMKKCCIMCGGYLSDEEVQFNGDICYTCEEEFDHDDDDDKTKAKTLKSKNRKKDCVL